MHLTCIFNNKQMSSEHIGRLPKPLITVKCRAAAQAVRRWLPTAAALVRVRADVGFVVDKAALGQVFSGYFVSHANHSTNFSIIIITWGWHNRSLVAAVPSGLNCPPPPTLPVKKKIHLLK
jgi:hypothetical protein